MSCINCPPAGTCWECGFLRSGPDRTYCLKHEIFYTEECAMCNLKHQNNLKEFQKELDSP